MCDDCRVCSGPTTHVMHNWFFLQIYHKYDNRIPSTIAHGLEAMCFVLYFK